MNKKQLEKFNNSLEKSMEIIARNLQGVVGKKAGFTQMTIAIIRDKDDDTDLDSVNCHKWYVSVRSSSGKKSNTSKDFIDKTFYMDLED